MGGELVESWTKIWLQNVMVEVGAKVVDGGASGRFESIVVRADQEGVGDESSDDGVAKEFQRSGRCFGRRTTWEDLAGFLLFRALDRKLRRRRYRTLGDGILQWGTANDFWRVSKLGSD